MPTVTQTIEAIVSGDKFTINNNITGSHISTIDSQFTLATAADNYDIPFYAESDADGDIKFIAFSSTVELDTFKLLDESDVEVVDLLAAIPDSTVVAFKTYQLPGSADIPTVSNTNDIKKLRVSGLVNGAQPTIQLSVLFDADTSDTIV